MYAKFDEEIDFLSFIDTSNFYRTPPIVNQNISTIDILKECCSVQLGIEHNFPDLFGKYGKTTLVGVYSDAFVWNENLKNATEEELWKMIAICSLRNLDFYKRLSDTRYNELTKLRLER